MNFTVAKFHEVLTGAVSAYAQKHGHNEVFDEIIRLTSGGWFIRNYKSGLSWKGKIIAILLDHGKLKTTHIANIIKGNEPWRNRREIVAGVSAVLSTEKLLFGVEKDVRDENVYYLLPSRHLNREFKKMNLSNHPLL